MILLFVTKQNKVMLSFCNLFPNTKSFGYNHAVNAETVVYIDGNKLKREQCLKHLGITSDRILCGNEYVTRTSCREIKALRAFRNRFELANSFWFKATVSGVMENQEQDLDR